jgi:hypothetical protein
MVFCFGSPVYLVSGADVVRKVADAWRFARNRLWRPGGGFVRNRICRPAVSIGDFGRFTFGRAAEATSLTSAGKYRPVHDSTMSRGFNLGDGSFR